MQTWQTRAGEESESRDIECAGYREMTSFDPGAEPNNVTTAMFKM